MTDPWADVRKKYLLGTFQQITKDQEADLKRVLSDADALLAAVREELLMLRKHHYESSDFNSFAEWLDKNRPNFADLPEHLKGNDND